MNREDELLNAIAENEWQTINQVVCRIMMMYGYPPCMLCSLMEFCALCQLYQQAHSDQLKIHIVKVPKDK